MATTTNTESKGDATVSDNPLSFPFEHWNKCGSGRLETTEFATFVLALEVAAFRDGGGNHDGWVAYQTSAIFRLFGDDGEEYLTKAGLF